MPTPYDFRGHGRTGCSGSQLLFCSRPGTTDSGWQAELLRRYAAVLGASDDDVAVVDRECGNQALKHVERNRSMAEITRPGPLAGVRPIDFATVVMGPYAAQLIGDLGADVIKLEANPQVPEQLIEAIEKAFGSYSYAELSEKRDCKQLAALTH
jgi:hypothetical protein